MGFEEVVRLTVQVVDGVGVAVLAVGVAIVAGVALVHLLAGRPPAQVYGETRHMFGRVLLLGIEVLVAGDIIRTVAVDLSLVSLAELAGIVLIRTFLSWAIELEIEGRWPWQAATQATPGDGAAG